VSLLTAGTFFEWVLSMLMLITSVNHSVKLFWVCAGGYDGYFKHSAAAAAAAASNSGVSWIL
jgi:hypothetical protein